MITHPNAKINLGLHILNKRPDGYHNIETVFYPIGLCDRLEIVASENCQDYCFSSSGISLDTSDPEDNLVLRAYRLLQAEHALPPVEISLVKQIPSGAGLGGGSSDAAFTLAMLNKLFDLKLSLDELEIQAARLGADCPFFLRNRPIYAEGKGDIFSEIEVSLGGYYLLLVKPSIHISTPEAYSLVKPRPALYSLREAIQSPLESWKDKIRNDFEEALFDRYPEISHIKQQLYDLGARYASMSGSGSSVFAIFDHEPQTSACFDQYFVSGGLLP